MATQAELAKRYSSQNKGLKAQRQTNFAPPAPTFKPIAAPKAPRQDFFDKAAAVGKQTLSLAGDIMGGIGSFAKNTAVDIGVSGYRALIGNPVDYVKFTRNQTRANQKIKELDSRQQEVVSAYRSGKLSKSDYTQQLRDFSRAYSDISNEIQANLAGPTPEERALAVVETGANILSLGRYSVMSAGVKGVVSNRLSAPLLKAASKLDDVVTKIPAVRALVHRNIQYAIKREAQRAAGETVDQFIAREGRNIVAGLLIKRPLVYEWNIGESRKVYSEIMNGNYPEALKASAWMATQMLEGGPIGAAFRILGKAGKKVNNLARGRGSYIDAISARIGNGNPNQLRRFIDQTRKRAPEEFRKVEKTFRILQETNLRMAGDRADEAAELTLNHYVQHGYDLSTLTPSQLYKDMNNWAEADEKLRLYVSSGIFEKLGIEAADQSKLVVVRWDTGAKNALAGVLRKAGNNPIRQMEALNEIAHRPGVGWGNNEILMNRLTSIVNHSTSADDAARQVMKITTASTLLKDVPKNIAKEFARLGYTVAMPFGGRRTPSVDYEDTRKLLTGIINKGDEVFDQSNPPSREWGFMANILSRGGLSPVSANQVAQRKLSEQVVLHLDSTPVGKELGLIGPGNGTSGGQWMLNKLREYIETKQPARIGQITSLGRARTSAIHDMRQLSLTEIAGALKISTKQAREVYKAVVDAHLKVPLEARGLADRVVDVLYKVNPLNKYYSRVQSALRYTYNPFFTLQEQVETKMLSHLKGNNLIWMRSRQQLDEGAKLLDDYGIFTATVPGEAAQDVLLGRLSASLTQGQRRDLAGLAMKMAERRGLELPEMLAKHMDEVEDGLRVIVQYPREGILASPMARVLNLAFFPMRYNIKVTTLAAKELSKAPPVVQRAVINSTLSMKDWLASDEGIRWSAEHADALQVLGWLTPYNTIQGTLRLLSGGTDSWGELGLLGGLPLGLISQVLDSQGIIKLNHPYVDPKTGDVIPEYIPLTTRAKAATALVDVLGTMYTYPGRILGLPGKNAMLRDVVRTFIDTNGSDFEKRLDTDRLTEQQRRMIKVLKGDLSDEALDALYNAPADGSFNWYTLPPLDLPVRPLRTKQRKLPAPNKPSGKRGPRAKKKALPIPPRGQGF